jgi:hypothetical protein
VPIGGVILFDSRGQLVSRAYSFKCADSAGTAFTSMGARLFAEDPTNNASASQVNVVPSASDTSEIRSSIGFVLFERDAFNGAGWTATDPQVSGGSSEATTEEAWLDQYAIPMLINRYNGTLVKAE